VRRQHLAVVAATTLTGLLLAAALGGTAAFAETVPDGAGSASAPAAIDYAGDPDSESLISAAEERRLIEVRSIANAADWSGLAHYKPYRLALGALYTLVLVARDAPYTLDDIAELAPRTFTTQPDGSFLLAENLVVEQGASLDLSSDDGLVLRLQSTAKSFTSIVTLGGNITVGGTADEPASITSWDVDTGKVDTDTSDGRAYIRVIGGHADLGYALFDHLGFWSGMTGGVSLTGTDLPDKGADTLPEKGTNSKSSDVQAAPATKIFGTEILPTGEAGVLAMDADLSGYSYVSALIHDVTFSSNAFGLFVTSADGVVIRDSAVTDSLVDGLVFHRHVKNSEIKRTTANGNAQDGVRLTRATSGIVLDHITANENGRDGISLDGQSLAVGPSATGMPVGSYGNNSVSNSTASSNARYGIEVIGGDNITVDGNSLKGNDVGIVVRSGATTVTVKDNTVEESVTQGIAFRDAGTDNTVRGNTVVGGEIGIYLRDAGGEVTRNTVEGVSNHAVTLIGETGSSAVTHNVVSGTGPSAIDVARTSGASTDTNDTESWRSTKPIAVILRGIFQPLTVMWILLGLLLLVTALSSIGRRNTTIRNPYANLAPLSSFTTGEISRDQVNGGDLRLRRTRG